MNAIDTIRQWCAANGYSFCYGNPMDVNRWMTETDFSASTDSTAVYTYLLTASEYDGMRDSYNVGVYFAELCDLDFNNQTIDTTTEALKERAKALLTDLAQGNAVSWSGARFTYGYNDFAENVVWCCMRVTLTALAAECVEMPTPTIEVVSVPSVVSVLMTAYGLTATTHDDIVSGTGGTYIFFGSSVVSQTDLSSYTATIMCNGTELTDINYGVQVVDETAIANVPALADYEGWYMAYLFSNDAVTYQSGAYNVVISIGNVWTATETWEEE